jgi:hypothetical protein
VRLARKDEAGSPRRLHLADDLDGSVREGNAKGFVAMLAVLGIDEVMWAARSEHLKKTGQIPADEPGEAEGPEAPAGSDEGQPEGPTEPAAWMSV